MIANNSFSGLPPLYRRRAVVVGINYTSCGEIALKGCANDAYAFALSLVNMWHFDPRDILLLSDDVSVYQDSECNPGNTYSSMQKHMPYRSLKWLTGGVHPGDVLVFYFAGHGLQIDNLSGWEGEGFDEAILPLDCTHQHGDVNAISAVCLRKHFLSVSERIQLSIFLDCAGNQSALDVSGHGKWNFIKGVVQKGIWPLTDPTDKMQRAKFDSRVWTAPVMKAKDVRPRIRKGAGEKTHAYMIAGARLCPTLKIRACDPQGRLSHDYISAPQPQTHHGAFTWSLIKAFSEVSRENVPRRVSFTQLTERILHYIRDHGLPKINQQPTLTCYIASGSDPKIDCLFFPFGGRVKTVKYHQGTSNETYKRKGVAPIQHKPVDALEGKVRRISPQDMLNSSHLDAAMKAYSSKLSCQGFAQKHLQALEQAWRSPVARSTIM